jgi:hypothetical protein
MHEAAVRVQAVLRGRKGRVETAEVKRTAHSLRLLHVRFVFLHVLKHIYLSFVEDGIVPARSLLAHDLTNSVDLAMDHLGLPLFDWAVIVQEVITLPWYKKIWVPHSSRVASDSSLFTPGGDHPVEDIEYGPRLSQPAQLLKVAATLAAQVASKQQGWNGGLVCLWRWVKRSGGALVRALRLDALMLKLHLSEYDEHAVYVLRCFILAHEESQRELHADLTADDASDVRAEVVEVVQESQLAVHEARRYLRQLTAVSEQRGIADLVIT